jgi:copper chaperone CopZ
MVNIFHLMEDKLVKKRTFFGLALVFGLVLAITPNLTFACGGQEGSSNSSSGTEIKATAVNSGSGACSGMKATKANSASGSEVTSADAKCDYKGKCADITMNIKGMTCTGCEASITEALKKNEGVIKVVSIDYKTGKAVVCYDPTKVESSQLTAVVTKSGYEAEIIPAVATSSTNAPKKGLVCDMTGKCEKKSATKTESQDTSH